jgi:UDP-N-acetylglucosamine 2-epimerase (hydrolysing)
MKKIKKILFITGTRADYGKIKPLIKAVEQYPVFEAYVYVTGMHLLDYFGSTYKEVQKDGYKNIHIAYGSMPTSNMSYNLGNSITYFTSYVNCIKPDMIVVHGDRVDALAAAIVGAFENILVAHVEGGELSGTIDESIRHGISKFAHLHFVTNNEAKKRLLQLGEKDNTIFIIGSPDIDIMLSNDLPSLDFVKKHYDIGFKEYAIMMYHPVTTEQNQLTNNIKAVVDALIDSEKNYVVVYPNNDSGSNVILREYERLKGNDRFRIYPSLRFEYFLVMLKNATFMIGNSSAGVKESSIYAIPAIDVGSRQEGRYALRDIKNIQHTVESVEDIMAAIGRIEQYRWSTKVFGEGQSTKYFKDILENKSIWETQIQKRFVDMGT